MRFNEKKIRARVIGGILLVAWIFTMLIELLRDYLIFGFAIGYGMGIFFPGSLQFWLILISKIILIYPVIRYLRNKAFKRNLLLGLISIIIGIYLLYRKTMIFSGMMGGGGEAHLVEGFALSLYFVILGMALMLNFSMEDKNKI
jgi:hypothetical protein